MKRGYECEGIRLTKKGLRVSVVVDAGLSKRFIEVLVPWQRLTACYRSIVDGMEREAARQISLEKDVLQLPLPLEKWE